MHGEEHISLQNQGDILGSFLSVVMSILGFILIKKIHHMWVIVPNVLNELRLKSMREELIVGFLRWLSGDGYGNQKDCLKGKVL